MAELTFLIVYVLGAAITGYVLYRVLGPHEWKAAWNDPNMAALGLCFNFVAWPIVLPIIGLVSGLVYVVDKFREARG